MNLLCINFILITNLKASQPVSDQNNQEYQLCCVSSYKPSDVSHNSLHTPDESESAMFCCSTNNNLASIDDEDYQRYFKVLINDKLISSKVKNSSDFEQEDHMPTCNPPKHEEVDVFFREFSDVTIDPEVLLNKPVQDPECLGSEEFELPEETVTSSSDKPVQDPECLGSEEFELPEETVTSLTENDNNNNNQSNIDDDLYNSETEETFDVEDMKEKRSKRATFSLDNEMEDEEKMDEHNKKPKFFLEDEDIDFEGVDFEDTDFEDTDSELGTFFLDEILEDKEKSDKEETILDEKLDLDFENLENFDLANLTKVHFIHSVVHSEQADIGQKEAVSDAKEEPILNFDSLFLQKPPESGRVNKLNYMWREVKFVGKDREMDISFFGCFLRRIHANDMGYWDKDDVIKMRNMPIYAKLGSSDLDDKGDKDVLTDLKRYLENGWISDRNLNVSAFGTGFTMVDIIKRLIMYLERGLISKIDERRNIFLNRNTSKRFAEMKKNNKEWYIDECAWQLYKYLYPDRRYFDFDDDFIQSFDIARLFFNLEAVELILNREDVDLFFFNQEDLVCTTEMTKMQPQYHIYLVFDDKYCTTICVTFNVLLACIIKKLTRVAGLSF